MKKITLTALAMLIALAPVHARKKDNKKKNKAKTEAPAPAKKPEPKPSISRQGLLNVEKVEKEWYLEIPDSLLGKSLLTTTRYTSTPSSSGQFGGELCNEQVIYFELNNDSTLFIRSQMTVNVADTTQMINKAVIVSNENPIIGAFKIESHKENRSRIKVTQFLNEDNPLGMHQSTKKFFNLTSPQPQLSYIQDIKTFPTNTEVRLVKTYNSTSHSLPGAAQTGKLTFGLNISFVMLPEKPMLGRYYDPRVGYFTERYNSFNDEQQRVESKIYISRYRLEPREEDIEKMRQGQLVEPVKPIIYYIDPATPKQWRKYLIAGVNDWQKAFEKAGFKNAIRGEEWPENDTTMSMEDARYSVIRYLASPIPNAYGPHISDPRTGEILEAHVCWYHNVMSLVHDWYMVQASSIDEAARKMHYDEELMGQLIRFVSSHEVGHSLGLRHNFGSSAMVPTDSLRSKAWVEAHGHTPSIMDYARFNYVAQPEDNISQAGIFPRIGDYDEWAIEWGYRPMLDAYNSDQDHRALEPLVQQAQQNPRLWWGDGEGLRGVDPRRQTEDLGDDPVKSSNYGIMNLKREMANLEAWTADPDDIYDRNLMEMYSQFRSQYIRYAGHVAGYIGGTYTTYRTRQMGGTLYQPTPLERQKASFRWIVDNLLTEPAWMRQYSYCTTLTADPRDLTLSIARSAARLLLPRIYYANDLYPAYQYMDDIVRHSYTEAQSGQSVSKYRQALQSQIVSELITYFRSEANSTSPTRAYALYMLTQIQQKIKSPRGDAPTRSHFQNLNDQISRALVIN